MKFKNASHAFLGITKKLIGEKRVFGLHVEYPFDSDFRDKKLEAVFDMTFQNKLCYKYGDLVSWRYWLEESGFPYSIYEANKFNLLKTIKNSYGERYAGKNQNHNFFGCLCRPVNGTSYMDYLIKRWSDKKKRSMPFFYFDLHEGSWIYKELMQNKNQIRSGRTSVACCTNIYFRWNNIVNKPITGWIMKHCEWSHLWEDIFSPVYIMKAICEHLKIKFEGYVSNFFISLNLDKSKIARSITNGYK